MSPLTIKALILAAGVIPNIEYSNMVGQSVSTLEAVYTIAVFIQIIGIILIIIKIKKWFE